MYGVLLDCVHQDRIPTCTCSTPDAYIFVGLYCTGDFFFKRVSSYCLGHSRSYAAATNAKHAKSAASLNSKGSTLNVHETIAKNVDRYSQSQERQ
jgi:hypothetical protein